MIWLLFYSVYIWSLCEKFQGPKLLGHLDSSINEASGIAQYKDKFYHINDSGDGPFVYETDKTGELLRKIEINNFFPLDVEDLAIGKCGESTCLLVADIGDNFRLRPFLQIILLDMKDVLTEDKVEPYLKMQIRYPDRIRRNAESIAFHPNGDVYLLTKEENIQNATAMDARLYRIEKRHIDFREDSVDLEFIKEIPISSWQGGNKSRVNWQARIATAMDIDPSGKKLLILTYRSVIEVKFLEENMKYKIHPLHLRDLPQQEAIMYLDKNSFVVTTERKRGTNQPIYKWTCARE